MRLRTCLAALLLLPLAAADVEEPNPLVHLYGYQQDHIVLEWDTGGLEPTRLELVRVLEGQVEVIRLDPSAQAYADVGVTVEMNVTYLLYVEAYGQFGVSNVYDGHCPFAGRQDDSPYVYVEPRCIRDAPVVPASAQSELKEVLAGLLPT